MGELTGKINETRRTFQATTGETGTVEFGRADDRGQFVRVDLNNGRQAWGKYRNAGNVRLFLKAIYTRAGKRLD